MTFGFTARANLQPRTLGSRSLIGAAVAAACLSATAAHAQQSEAETAPQLEEITVTGSRIKRAGFDTLQPATVVSADAHIDRGVTNVADALKDMPAFGLPTSGVGNQSNVQVGQSFVNFFGLGSQRTLTLVDGRRFVAANSLAVSSGSAPGLQVDKVTTPALVIHSEEDYTTPLEQGLQYYAALKTLKRPARLAVFPTPATA